MAVTSTVVMVCTVVGVSAADTVRLKNGDVLTGKILKATDDEVLLDTDHSGEVEIETKYVVDLESDRPLTIEYEDGREVDGYIDVGPGGKLIVRESAPQGKAPAQPAAEAAEVVVDLTPIKEIREVTTFFHYDANVDIGLNVAKGNSDSENANVSARFVPSFGKNTIELDGQWNRGKAEGELAAANWRVNAQYDREFWDRWFWLLFNSYEHDRLQDLNLRITAGGGVGYKFFEPDPTLLKVALGPAFVDENFEGNDDDRKFAALRWRLDFKQDVFSDDVSIYHTQKILIGLTEDQFVFLTVQGLKFDLIADFALLLEFQFDHNNSPAEGAKQNDFRYLVKLGYEFNGDENDWWQ
jgi:putative salt-induced outer membrane protein YdiY